jgi:nitrogen fixation NifU-like protein
MNQAENLKNLYRDTVLDHSRHPRNFRRLENPSHHCQGHNPLCGDKITLYLKLSNENIDDIAFEGTGCAISVASASIMTESMRGKCLSDADQKLDEVIKQFTTTAADKPVTNLGDMAALSGVRAYPSRIKCATLPWKTLQAGLRGGTEPATTE